MSAMLLLERLKLISKTGLLCDSYILFLIKSFYLSNSYKISPTEAGGNQSLSDYRNQQPITIRKIAPFFMIGRMAFFFYCFLMFFLGCPNLWELLMLELKSGPENHKRNTLSKNSK
jgi:hypothetical protein